MNLALTLGGVEAELLRQCCNEKAQFIGGLSKGGVGSVPRWCHIEVAFRCCR